MFELLEILLAIRISVIYYPRCYQEESIGETGSRLGENEKEVQVDHNGCNAGWAGAMARVLKSKKPKRSRSIVLSRAKKLNENAKSVHEKETSFKAGDVSQDVSSLIEQHPRRKVGNSSVVKL
jgi:hypothetical protein